MIRPSLFGTLHLARQAIGAYSYALDIAGQELANAGTPGHARRTPDLRAASLSTGGGVEAKGFFASRDEHLESAFRRELAAYNGADARAQALSNMDAFFGSGLGVQLTDSLEAFYDSLSGVPTESGSPVKRAEVVAALDQWADAMRDAAGEVERDRFQANDRVQLEVGEINFLLQQAAQLNRDIQAQLDPLAQEPVKDQLANVLAQLADHVDFVTRPSELGGVVVSLPGGPVLVGDREASRLEVRPAASGDGMVDVILVSISGSEANVTTRLVGGRVGGLLAARDGTLLALETRLDEIAVETAAAFNTIHAAGFTQGGAPAGDLFDPLPATNPAKELRVSAAILADASQFALAGSPAPGDLSGAKALWDTRTEGILDGGTTPILAALSRLGQVVGYDASQAAAVRDQRAALRDEAEHQRDLRSATNLEQTITDLMRYQRGMEAATGYLRTINEVFDDLFSIVR